jgi:hypothetical protein
MTLIGARLCLHGNETSQPLEIEIGTDEMTESGILGRGIGGIDPDHRGTRGIQGEVEEMKGIEIDGVGGMSVSAISEI